MPARQLSVNKITFSKPTLLLNVSQDGEVTKLGGLAAPFNQVAERGDGTKVSIQRGAFDKLLMGNSEVRLFTDHEYKVENLLATRSANTLKLWQDDQGLHYEAQLPPTTEKVSHLVTMARQGSLGASVGVPAGGLRIRHQDGIVQYTEMMLDEISITPIPVFESTTAETYSMRQKIDVWIKTFLVRQEASKKRYVRYNK